MNVAAPAVRPPSALRRVSVIAGKEITDAFRNRLFVVALAMLLLLSLTAVALGATAVHAKMADYNQSVQMLKSIGRSDFPPPPPMNPLAVSKTFINYLAMVGALLAMILGFSSVRKERDGGTLPLILSRPVYRDQFLAGKIAGNALLLAALMAAVGAATAISLLVIGGVSLAGSELAKLGITMVMAWLYVLIFYLVAMFLSLVAPKGNQALLIAVIVWLVFAFIFPQIGDTMDLDNQLPGGFFATMGMDRAGETAALKQFKWYEVLRDGVEELSPTKHLERVSFALLGIKQEFAKDSWSQVLALKAVNVAGLVAPIVLLIGASYVVFLRQDT